MHILVLSDNFVPERNAPALRTFSHCKRWVEQGAKVTVITSVPNFPTGKVRAPYKNKIYQREVIAGIEVVRVWTYLAPNIGVVRRSLDFLSYAVTAFLAGLRERPDVILATSPQLLTGAAGAALAFIKRCPWVFEVRDLWPDSITAVHAVRQGAFISILRWLEGLLYRHATHIVTVSDPLKNVIGDKNIALEKISVVPNGVGADFQPHEKNELLLSELGLEGKFVVGYIGTHGLAQGLEVIVHAAALLKYRDEIQFLLIGEGAAKQAVQDLASSLGLRNVHFLKPVSSRLVPQYVSICDTLVVPLKKSWIAPGAIPSKIFEAAAMARPILLSIDGISAEIIARYNAGLVVEPENPAVLASAVVSLLGDVELRNRLGEGGMSLARDYNRQNMADRLLARITLLSEHRLLDRAQR